LGTQWPVGEHVSSGLQSLADWQAAMQLPELPPTGHVQEPPGPQTIGIGGAAPSMRLQSESMLQGSWGMAQMPQPMITPPGVHCVNEEQSAPELQRTAPSDRAPESAAQDMFDVDTVQPPPLHVAETPHP
jgi:hypothetical protein